MSLIDDFLKKLQSLHVPKENGFDIRCLKCGSLNCQVALWPDVWFAQEDKTQLQKGLLGLKCLDCGMACDVDYGIEAAYG